MTNRIIYKLLRAEEWASLQTLGYFDGSADDKRDGFIHASTATQTPGTLAKYFNRDVTGGEPVYIAAIKTDSLGEALVWEPSRGGQLFPHLYGRLSLDHISDHAELGVKDGAEGYDATAFLNRG